MTQPTGRSIAHVNDIAFVASTLAAAQRRRGDRAEVVEAPKPGARRGAVGKWLLAPVRIVGLALLAAGLRRRRLDVVHVHYATHAVVGAWSGHPYVVHCHGSDVRGVRPGSVRGWLLKRYLRRASLVLYSTPDLRPWVLEYRPDARYLPNPIDIDLFRPSRAPDRDLLLGVRLDPVKGAEVAIKAAAMLLEKRPDATVTVIEQGPLVEMAHEMLQHRAQFIPPVPHDQLPAVLSAHRVALGQFKLRILSQLELEAMACGALVVAAVGNAGHDDGPPPIAQAATAASACDAITDALSRQPGDALQARRQRREWVASHHASALIADRLARLYPGNPSSAASTPSRRPAA